MDHLYCICPCLTEVSNIPYIWRCPVLHIAVPFPMPQEGSAASRSNPRAFDTFWFSEEPPTSPQHLCLVQQGVRQNCSALPERGWARSPTSICCSILRFRFLPRPEESTQRTLWTRVSLFFAYPWSLLVSQTAVKDEFLNHILSPSTWENMSPIIFC